MYTLGDKKRRKLIPGREQRGEPFSIFGQAVMKRRTKDMLHVSATGKWGARKSVPHINIY